MKNLLQVVSILLLFGCAQQVAPTGGPKDVTPPEVLEEIPANLSTEFTGNAIEIKFDEFIQIKSAAEQVVISPPMLRAPSFQLKRKSLIVKFEQDLAENTTYTINFGEAIVDNNEGNILQNYTYVFSTGSMLDSMQVKGKLTDVLTGEPEQAALVMLYKTDSDSLPLDTIPDYFTRTDESGQYHIKNVADQPYKIFALKDENANYKFDVPTEKIGFLDSLILPFSPPAPVVQDTSVTDTVINSIPDSIDDLKSRSGFEIPSYDMVMFVEEDTTQFLKKAFCDQYGKLVFIYNRPTSGFEFSIDGFSSKKQWKLEDLSTEGDSVTVWVTDVVPDTLVCLLNVDGLQQDTVELQMKSLEDSKKRSSGFKGKGKASSSETLGLKLKFNPPKGTSPNPEGAVQVIGNHPILGFDITRLKLYEDSARVVYDISSEDPALRRFDISYPWKEGKRYRLLALDSAFSDLYGFWNDSSETSFLATGKDSYGSVSVKLIEAPSSNIVFEVLSGGQHVVERASTAGKATIEFNKLPPGEYSVDAIRDLNGNGKWDSGRYLEKTQPEPIVRIKDGAEVRANWDFEIEWTP